MLLEHNWLGTGTETDPLVTRKGIFDVHLPFKA